MLDFILLDFILLDFILLDFIFINRKEEKKKRRKEVMVKLAYDSKMKSPKGPCVVVIHANWCGFCKTLMPKFENQIVTSDDFDEELEGALTLGSIEETEYNNHPEKKIFGKIDGYPIVRYIHFSQHGKPMKSFDLPSNIPREPKDIIDWINGVVKNDIGAEMVKKHRKSNKQQIMKIDWKKKKNRTMRKKYKTSRNNSKIKFLGK